jgi:hypothetical protein
MLTNKKAVSTIILIILILCSAVFGALISYMWVMGNFFLEPDTTDVVITNVDFPVDHADYFYVTVMNPSHSLSKTNITEIYFTVEGDTQLHNVTDTSPESLPITLEKETEKTIKCIEPWGEFAGKNITIYVSASSASGAVASFATSFVELKLNVAFDASISCKHFNVTITNDADSAINLTLTKLLINLMPIETAKRRTDGENVTIYGTNLPNTGESLSLQCFYDWETLSSPKVRVETSEGYYAEAKGNSNASVLLLITNVAFNKTNPNDMSITVENSAISYTKVDIDDIVLTYLNGTIDEEYHVNGSLTNPTFAPYYELGINKTVTFDHCVWNWKNFRDQNVTINVYTKQEYTPVSTTVKTPNETVFSINSSFNLTDTGHFWVNITNMACSLQNITVTQIKFNANQTSFTPQTIPAGNWTQLNCAFNWTAFRGISAIISVNASDVVVSQNVTLPYMLLNIVNASFATSGNGKEFNITIENSINSLLNATLTRIVVCFGNETVFQSEGIGYIVEIGKNVTLTFSWDWSEYETKEVTISVYIVEGLEFVATFII